MTDSTLAPEDRERYDTIRSCINGDLTNAEAAARLHLKIRQVQKLKLAVKTTGEQGVIHGNRSRVPWNATGANTTKSIVVFLKKKNHRDFGPTFAMEQLEKQKDIALSRETVRSIMIKQELWKSRPRTGSAIHRAWRERKSMYGELVQFDGSYHRWFENTEKHCLLAAIDDATGTVSAVFEDNEGVHAVFRFWWRYVGTRGLPGAIYLDKFSTYKVNHESAVDNEELMTQFTRAMRELDVRVINANSPEAKGRVERLFGTLQDRLVKELRLDGSRDRETANRFLDSTYLPDHNKRFGVPAREKGNAHRPLTKEQRKRLPSIFSVQSKRVVTNDFTIQFKSRWYQLSAQQPIAVYRADIVTIEERLDGTTHMRLRDTYLSFTLINKLERATRPRVTALTKQTLQWKPPADHPWRRAAAAETAKKRTRLRHAR